MKWYDPKDDEKWQLFRRFMGEFVATVFFQFGISAVNVVGFSGDSNATNVQVALATGFIVTTLVAGLGHVSGAHLNPAVTLGFLVVRGITPLAAGVYIIAQLIGTTIGAAFVKAVTPEAIQGNLGSTLMSDLLNVEQGVLVEALATAFLMMVILGVTDSTRQDNPGAASIPIGLTIAHLIMALGRYSGASMNPARSFGPAVVSWTWDHHWIYWVGPIIGAVLMAFLYQNVLKNSLSFQVTKVKSVALPTIRSVQ